MKIIRNGRESKHEPRRFVCNGCTSELEAKPSDSKRTETGRDGSSYVFECPVCQAHIWIKTRVFEGPR